MIGFILAAAVALGSPAAPQPASRCDARPDCRHVTTVTVRNEQGGVDQMPVNQDVDFVQDGRLVLLPGEMVTVALHERPDGDAAIEVLEKWPADSLPVLSAEEFLKQMDASALSAAMPLDVSSEILNARKLTDKVLRISFLQLANRPDTLLIVEDGYDRRLDYHADVMFPHRDWKATTVCQVNPSGFVYEHWPQPIFSIALSSFDLLEPDQASDVCD